MIEVQHPPHAASLLESMRSIGYTLDSALADLIDNSISAHAREIHIEFRPFDNPYIAIIDDGRGMSYEVLQNAMRHGSKNPLLERGEDDMGRYGLGLKTASISQCRRMTVISKKDADINAFCWDLDVVIEKGAWVMLQLEISDCEALPHFSQLVTKKSGTMVLWQELDKLLVGEANPENALGAKMLAAREHLALVFHRFLAKEGSKPKISMVLNGSSIVPFDPFLVNHKATQPLDEEKFSVEGKKVVVKPYILPHISKLSGNDAQLIGGNEGFRSQQGFYIYRNRRLIIWGTWFRLARKDELSKLARVRVDIPNALDHLWTLDIKKSAAHPPELVRLNLKRTVEKIRSVSGRTIAFRGRNTSDSDIAPAWNEVLDRSGIRFDVNRNHPLISEFSKSLDKDGRARLNLVLGVIESSFPADALYSRMASDIRPDFASDSAVENINKMISNILINMPVDSPTKKQLLMSLHLIEPFNLYPELTKQIIEEYNS
ncbi:ATP-binding protein [Pseudomonas lactis]|uniref:ATP-binding protein n=1 Tax=Pseudomonas lactis TaxID=1615674 RepID=A0A7Y1M504_9PSED|nr:ATP-binding protein [Pseudomonas lactis]NNA75325.1 ATP-binding protein [Pseudomonas lactis]